MEGWLSQRRPCEASPTATLSSFQHSIRVGHQASQIPNLHNTSKQSFCSTKCDDRQLETISTMLKHATDVAFVVEPLARTDSLAVDTSRPRRGMIDLGRFKCSLL